MLVCATQYLRAPSAGLRYFSSPAVGGSSSDSYTVIGCSSRRLPWHIGCCTDPQHQQATDLHPPRYPSLFLFFLLLCLSSSHYYPCSLFSVPSPPTWKDTQACLSTLQQRSINTTAAGIAAAATAAGGLVGVLRPVSLLIAAQARHRILLWSLSRTIFLRSVRACESRNLASSQRGLPHPGNIITSGRAECSSWYFHSHAMFIMYLFLSLNTRIHLLLFSALVVCCFSFILQHCDLIQHPLGLVRLHTCLC